MKAVYKRKLAGASLDEHLIEKFITGTVTEKEAEAVLDWFGTDEGQIWLSDRFDRDAHATCRAMESLSVSGSAADESEPINNYAARMHHPLRKHSFSSRSSAPKWLTAAAVVVVAVILSLMQFYYTDQAEPVHSVEYSTGYEEHRIITLSNGTRVRLNENSTIEIPETWSSEHRTVYLQGEAFFEVSADSLRPFIVDAERGRVQVLGTAFNVKTETRSGSMLVAVSEGLVSLASKEEPPVNHHILEENMLGLLNRETYEIIVEHTDVSNYVNWMHGRVVYNSAPFGEVIRQLSHIYDIQNDIENEELLTLKLTADFSERSLDNVLETIAHSLDIEVKRDGYTVKWKITGRE